LNRQGVLLVVSGPSGVGKGTIIRGLMSRRPDLRKSVSCTTRSPRPGERPGVDYHFVSPADFGTMRTRGELLEWAVVHQDLYYGTPRRPVEEALSRGEDIILEIDYQGARSVRLALGGRAVLVFVAPPSWGELHARLVGRETEAPEDVLKRLHTARREFAHMDLFQFVLVNESVQQAVDDLEAVLVAEKQRLGRADWRSLQAEVLADAEADGR